MKFTATFVLLQYIIGFAFAIIGMFLLPEPGEWSLQTSIFYSFLVSFFCMLLGVCLVGYFHLRLKKAMNRFGKAMALSFTGLLLFLLLYIFIERFLPSEFGILTFFLPLTGAVFGFNLIVTMTNSNDQR